jgi:hypothetical protein
MPSGVDAVDPTMLEAFPEHAKIIAFIIAEWSQVEYKLGLWLALRLSADGRIIQPMIYAIESSRARINAMHSAITHLLVHDPKSTKAVDAIFGEVSSMLNLRNRYAHAHFGRDSDSEELAIAAPPGKTTKPFNIPLHELQDHFSKMKRLSHKLGVILAAELKLPLKGPDAPASIPAHPLGMSSVRQSGSDSASALQEEPTV